MFITLHVTAALDKRAGKFKSLSSTVKYKFNSTYIKCFREAEGGGSWINFNDDDSVRVEESYAAVEAALHDPNAELNYKLLAVLDDYQTYGLSINKQTLS